MRKKVTEDSHDLSPAEAKELVLYYAEHILDDTRNFKKNILDRLKQILERGYSNEAGLKAVGNLLTREVEAEVKISSDSDGRKNYYCVMFKNGGMACTCSSFITRHNATKPKGKCKHLVALIERRTF